MRRMIPALLTFALSVGWLTSCTPRTEANPSQTAISPITSQIVSESTQQMQEIQALGEHAKMTASEKQNGFTEFDSTFIQFLEESGYQTENFLISPLSFKAALALAVSGSDGETRQQLLQAMGFQNIDEVNTWYASILAGVDSFAEDLAYEQRLMNQSFPPDMELELPLPDRAYRIANSIWHNRDLSGTLNPEYIAYVAEHYRATAAEANASEITDQVNQWVDDQTNGLIPQISDDLSGVNAILINALYLRTSWAHDFRESQTQPDLFTTINGDSVEKLFMNQKNRFQFYEDEETKLIAMPMRGNLTAAFVLGQTDHILTKLQQASDQEVIVKLPKFEIESSFTHRELVHYLENQGATLPFLPEAGDFSILCTDDTWYIDDIIQKAKIKADEDGIEAAAVTAVYADTAAMITESAEPKEFIADRPFTFYIFNQTLKTPEEQTPTTPELLFYGQYVN